ncbi:TIGR02452 family protein [Streptomyces spongiicola]|uniref:TIGR02452 family protein n=1 Tax=Streptomyces spongiicola TaxID=1690221 RepID=UPI001558E6C2
MRARSRGVARQTREIVDAGRYRASDGHKVTIGGGPTAVVEGTWVYGPGPSPCRWSPARTVSAYARSRGRAAWLPRGGRPGGTTTRRVSRASPRTAIPAGVPSLTSDRDSGGGCLNGAHAQEEALCRASALHTAPPAVPGFDAHHREVSAPFCSDRVIRPLRVPVPGRARRTPGHAVHGRAPRLSRARPPADRAVGDRRAALRGSGGLRGPTGGEGRSGHRRGPPPAHGRRSSGRPSLGGGSGRLGPGHRRADMRDGPGLTSVRA